MLRKDIWHRLCYLSVWEGIHILTCVTGTVDVLSHLLAVTLSGEDSLGIRGEDDGNF